MDISFNIALVAIAAMAATCILYAVNSTSRKVRRDAEIKHQEFEDGLQNAHQEKMAAIAAERDARIAQYTQQPPKPASKQIEG